MIITTGSATIRPVHFDAVLKLGVEHSARSRGEPGCIAHNCHVDAEDPQRIVFIEEWADMAPLCRPGVGGICAALGDWADGTPAMKIYAAEEVGQ